MLPPSTLVPSEHAIEPLPLPDIPWLLLIGNPLSAPLEDDIGDEGNGDEGNEEEISLLINSPKFP
jgi:hypothetical protein